MGKEDWKGDLEARAQEAQNNSESSGEYPEFLEREDSPHQEKSENKEAIYQEIAQRAAKLNEYISHLPNDFPDVDLLKSLSTILTRTALDRKQQTSQKANKKLISYLDGILHRLGYETISKIEKFELEDRAQLSGNETWLKDRDAAREELERLKPWAENGIGDERAGAQASMNIIYSKFPELNPNRESDREV